MMVQQTEKQKANNTLLATTIVIGFICILAICVFAFTFSVLDEPNTPEEFAKEYDGSVDAYREILTSNDCAFLQEKFDTAYETTQLSDPGTIHHKRATGFMTAADQRMEEIGCYDE
jgi:uncharacterized membrane protein